MANTFTVGEIEDRARLNLLDTNQEAYRFERKEVYVAIASAVQEVRTARPVSRYVNGLLAANVKFEHDIPVSPTDSFRNSVIQMERQWMDAVTYRVVHQLYLKDDPDTANQGLAQKYLELYARALQ